MLFAGPLTIGADSSPLNFMFDTNTDYLWVPDSTCTTCQATTKHTHTSDTATATTVNATAPFVQANGTIYTTNITIGGQKVTNFNAVFVTSYSNS